MNKARKQRPAGRGLALLLAASLLAPSPVAAQQMKHTSEGNQWPMKYEEGTEPIKHDTKMTVTVGDKNILCEPESGMALAIPVAGVKEVTYDTKARRRLAEAAGVAVLSLGVALVFVALKTKKHFVNVVWQEADGTDKEVVFKVGKGEYAAFLADLQRVTGKEWKNLEMEREKVRQELKTQRGKQVPVQLDRRVQLPDALLKPGVYQVVLLERGGNQGELYFFAGQEVNVKKIVGSAVVEILPASAAGGTAEVVYNEGGEPATIAEIRLPGKTLRLR